MRGLAILLLCVSLTLIYSCATTPPEEDFFEEELVVEEEPFEEEEFFEEEIEEIIEEPIEEIYEEETVLEHEVISPPEAIETLGFRVQIHAFQAKSGADSAADKARFQFPEKVYVDYVSPYYKVRVGDCMTRAEAEMLRARARQLGYTGAFIVETMVKP